MADLCAALNFKEGNREHVAVEKSRNITNYDLVSIAFSIFIIKGLRDNLRRAIVPHLSIKEAINDIFTRM